MRAPQELRRAWELRLASSGASWFSRLRLLVGSLFGALGFLLGKDAAGARRWISDQLLLNLARFEAPLLLAHCQAAAAQDWVGLRQLCEEHRASRETRAMLHELAQRMFAQQVEAETLKTETTEAETLQGEQALRFMRSHLRNTPTIAKPRVHLEVVHTLPGKKQNGKFWIGEASPVGLTLKWGKPDTVGQQHFIPAENCEGNNSVMELEARAEKKIKEGYSLNTTKSSF